MIWVKGEPAVWCGRPGGQCGPGLRQVRGAPKRSAANGMSLVDGSPVGELHPTPGASMTTSHFRRSLGRKSVYTGAAKSSGDSKR